MMGRPAGFRNKCIVVIPTSIGVIKTMANGAKRLKIKSTPTSTSIVLIMGKK